MKKKLLLLWGLVTLMASCVSEFDEFDNGVSSSGPMIKLDGTISQQYISRVNDGGFCHGDQIGLYGVNYSDGNTVQGTLQDKGNQVDNARYTFDEEKGEWTSTGSIYYKDVNTNIDLYAYYPYDIPERVSDYRFEVQADQSGEGDMDGYAQSDFLWGMVSNVVPSTNKVKISFSHRLACANVFLTEGEGFAEGEFASLQKTVMVSNTKRNASIDLATGVATAVGDVAKEGILMRESEGGYRAVVVPQTLAAGVAVYSITVDGITYRFKLDEEFAFKAGKQSKFTIQVSKKSMSGKYEFTLVDTDIVDWIADLDTHGGEARQYYVVHMEKPGTLGELIAADGKNPDKIRNLKISGNVSGADFCFMRDYMEILQAVNIKECSIKASTRAWCSTNGDTYTYLYLDGTVTNYEEARKLLKERYPDISIKTLYNLYVVNADEIPYHAFYGKESLVYFSFPEKVTKINDYAFSNTLLSGALVIPNDVTVIGEYAFYNTNISSLELPHHLKSIEFKAFSSCVSLAGTLSLPESLEKIGESAFDGCSLLSGTLSIPSKIKVIKNSCFTRCSFTGDLTIPEGVTSIGSQAFEGCDFNGQLTLPNSLKEIGSSAFYNCNFQGELCIPSQVMALSSSCFKNNAFTSIVFPEDSEILKIESSAFSRNLRLTEPVILPNRLVSIESGAFNACKSLPEIVIPATTATIGAGAFTNCYSLSSITCEAIEPPTLGSGVFDGVAKDNFTLEVPEQSVIRYQTQPGWSDFRRISAHHDFSISRPLLRALNASYSKTFTLRAPANQSWSIQSKPDWVTVTPSEGVGKVDVTITVSAMAPTDETFELSYIDTNGKTKYENHKGRAGEIVFLLDEKDYTSSMKVEQYNYGHVDGEVIKNHTATQGNGVNIVFMGDCFDARDIATGKYLEGINEAIEHYFSIEPYKSYKDYFNVYTVIGMSPDSGMGTVNTIKDAKFGSQYSLDGITPNTAITYEYAMKAETVNESNLNKTLVVMVENTTDYGGICYMWGDGSAIAICPMSGDAYPYDFRGIVQHEAGGHGFAKLADEYIYTNAFISSCSCPNKHLDEFNEGKSLGWYRNLSTNGDMNMVEWSHLIYHPDYSNVVDMYEGGYFHTRGIYRSEATSCMNNNIPYYSAISRQAMVERIMEYAGLPFSLDDFYANDVRDASAASRSIYAPWTINTTGAGKQYAPKYMGNKPNLNK